jgi:hypothetical protein
MIIIDHRKFVTNRPWRLRRATHYFEPAVYRTVAIYIKRLILTVTQLWHLARKAEGRTLNWDLTGSRNEVQIP